MKSNKEIIEELYANFKAGNGEGIANSFDPAIVWEQMEGFPNGGKYEGAGSIFKNVFAQFPKYWEGWGAQPDEFLEMDDRVFVLGHYVGKSKSTETRIKAPIVHIYTLKNGKIVHFKQYTDTHIIQKALNE